MLNRLLHTTLIFGLLAFAGLAQAHHASFESDLEGGDSSLEDPWEMVNLDIDVAFDHFSYLGAGDVDYLMFEGEAGQQVIDIYVVFPATLTFLPNVAIVGPGLSGATLPDWVAIPDGMGAMVYPYALDWLTEEAFEEDGVGILLAYDEPHQFTLPETGTYYIVIYHEDQQSGYYDIAHGEDHSAGSNAENYVAKFQAWANAALASEQSAVSSWEIYQ